MTEIETKAVQPLRLSIETREYANMGDHAERLTRSHVQVPGETVEDLVRRVIRGMRPFCRLDETDEVVIRLMVEADGETVSGGPAAVAF